jgi:hypothetical protein
MITRNNLVYELFKSFQKRLRAPSKRRYVEKRLTVNRNEVRFAVDSALPCCVVGRGRLDELTDRVQTWACGHTRLDSTSVFRLIQLVAFQPQTSSQTQDNSHELRSLLSK